VYDREKIIKYCINILVTKREEIIYDGKKKSLANFKGLDPMVGCYKIYTSYYFTKNSQKNHIKIHLNYKIIHKKLFFFLISVCML